MTTDTSNTITWSLPVTRWCYWQEEMQDPPLLDIAFIEPGLRRKLGPLAKRVLSLAHQCAGSHSRLKVVFASRNGDINRTTDMLLHMASGEQPSPTAFSLSVLNAAAGAFSIATQDTSPNTAISAGSASLGLGLLEASLQFHDNPEQPLLFMFADESPPAIYEADHPVMPAHAIAMLISPEARHELKCSMANRISTPDPRAQSVAFLDCLDNRQAAWSETTRQWHWSLHDR